MNKAKIYFLFLFSILSYVCLSQNEANTWYFGQYAGLDFNGGTPIPLTNSSMDQAEGCATISDAAGNLLFYTDGMTVWNQNHNVMPNGTGLMGGTSAAQSGIIVPKPGNPNIYYVFTVPAEIGSAGLRYSEVDMTLQAGLGNINSVKNMYLIGPTEEKVTAVRHNNNTDIWVITHLWDSDEFFAYLVTSTGINPTPVISAIGTYHTGPDVHGTMKVSSDGSKLAIILRQNDSFELFDFDNATGTISNPKSSAQIYPLAYGIEFSPDNSLVYISKYGSASEIFQFVVPSSTGNLDPGLLIGTANNTYIGTLQLAPDNKIYVAKLNNPVSGGDPYLGVIESPNILGTGCAYVDDGFFLDGGESKWGLPTFIQSYFSANITYQNDCFGDTTFFDISTSDPIQSILWNFGDPTSGSNNTSTELQPGHLFTSSGLFNVTASVVINNIPQDFSIDVTIYDVPQISLGNDTLICSNTTFLLDPGTGYASYLWQDNSTNELYTVTQAGLYWVKVTNSNGCETIDSIYVGNSPPLNVTLGNDTTYCFINSVTLHAGPQFATYLWQDGSTDSIFTVTNSGTYTVSVTDANGCAGGDTISIILFNTTVNLGNDTTVCSTDNFVLDAGIGFTSYLWNTGSTTQIINVPASGTYYVAASNASCTSYDTINVVVGSPPFSFAGSNESVCRFEQFDFNNSTQVPFATNYITLEWIGGTGVFSDPTILHPIYTPGTNEVGDVNLTLVAHNIAVCSNDTSTMILTIEQLPIADFNILPNVTSCVGVPISFEDISTTSITIWIWDFGDGNLSNVQNPTHLFNSPGDYIVTLIVNNSNGCIDTVDHTVTINPLPIVNYSFLPSDSICVNELISFTDNSTSNIQSWVWDFDDGNSSNIQNPNHSYLLSGDYNVQLTVMDNNTCVDSITSIIKVNQLPEPDFNILPFDTVCANSQISLIGYDIAGTQITDWQWDFGDGNLGTGQSLSHSYSNPGDYTITLSVLNNNSCTEINSKSVHIKSLPESKFTISPNDTSCMGELINLDAIDISGDIVSWDWQFGDGNAATGQNVSHIYSQQGNMNILSIFTNNLGCIDTAIHQRVVQDVNIWFNINQSPSCQNFNVDFVGVGDLVTFTPWEWSFGDGSASDVGHIVSHIYLLPDTLNVQLDVCSEQVIQQLIINATCQVDAGGLQRTCQDVYFNYANSPTPPTADGYSAVQWYTTGLGTFDNATLVMPTYFPHPIEGAIQNDTIIMTMIGYGVSPCANDTSYAKLIVIPGAYAQAGSDENSCFGVPYDFANSTDSSFATHYATLYWSTSGTGIFVDPNVMQPIYIPGPNEMGSVTLTMVAANIINCDSIDDMILTIRPTYEVPIDITVCYYDSVYAQGAWGYSSGIFFDTLQSVYGCDSVIVTNLVVRDKIDKDFTISTGDSICLGESSIFTQTGNANLTTWSWDFGDGNTSFDPNPTNTYTTAGIYDVIFSYIDENGCSDSTVQQAIVFDLPDVFFTSSMNDACVNTNINFSGGSNSNIQSWDWDFGDGQTGTGQNISHIYTTWGLLTVILTVTDVNGCSHTAYDNITIAQPPVADFTYEIALCDSLQFTDLSTSPSGYNLVTWYWDFGDGLTSTLQNPTHQYPSNTTPGGEVYNVTLTVVADSNGFLCSDSIVLPVTVPSLPDIFFTYTPDPSCLGDSTYFFGESGFFIDIWHWDFDDGNFSNQQYAAHKYANTGIYNVELNITDTNGCVNTLSNIITVKPVPTVSFSMSDTTACHGTEIQFTSTNSTNVAVWYWDFDDGSFSYDQNPIHYFPQGGTYNVSLTVFDSTGCSSTAINQVLILPGATADFTYQNLTCSSVVFQDLSIAPPGYFLTQWHWDFGDGFTATVQNPSHSYTTGIGVYYVTLIVTSDSAGYSCTDTITKTIYTPGLPTVFFTWNPEPTMLGNATDFFGTSGNVITDWYWDFGDGNFATTQNATHTFATVGTYNVELNVTDIDGCQNLIVHQVTVVNVPALDYSWNISCENEPVQFTVLDPPTDIPAVVSWAWNFGDGGISDEMNPLHVYVVAGTYNVSLTIIDTMASTNTVIKQITVKPPPVALFSIETPTCEGNPVQLHDHSTTPTGFITQWHWDFGDGNTQTITFPTSPDVTHTYGTTGTFIVTLTITNSDSCQGTTQNPVTTISSPMAIYTASDGCASGPVSFTNTSIENGGGTIVTYLWTFDDPGSGPDNTSNLENPVHMFSNPGDYDVTLTITNVNGCVDDTTTTITVADAPTVDFTTEDNCLGNETQFLVDGTVTNIPEVQTWAWTFGDGGTSSLQNPTHIYSAAGDYTVTLAIVTTDGCTASVTHTLRINPLPNPNFQSTAPACLNDEVEFTNLSSSPNGTIETWVWDFGDGTIVTINAPDNPDVTHLYTLDGTYGVILTVTDTEGCENSVTRNVEVVPSPIADFTYEENCYNDPTIFTDLSTTNGGTDIQSWEWFFGDPGSGTSNTSNLQNPSHIFSLPGTYTTTLIINSTMGCTDTTEKEIIVDTLPDVSMNIVDDSICLGEMAMFEGIGTNISTWFWTFGDGGSSIEQNPSYMYAAPGIYTVTLTVTEIGAEQCQSTVTGEIVVNGAPEAMFEYENTCLGDSTYFTDLSYSQYAFITNWDWDFGDGATSTLEDPSHYYQTNDDYLVTLIVTDNYGCTDTISQWVQVYDSPNPSFTWDQVCDPMGQVNFFDESEPGSDGAPIIGWNWNLDDGYYSTEIDPSYIYNIIDTCYTVILEVTDNNGCTATDTNTQVCLHGELSIDFTAETACEGQPTLFTATYAPQSDSVASYTWNFNDGSPLQVTFYDTILHTFPNPGLYIVELMAIDTNDCLISIFKEVRVDSLPTAQFTNTIGSCSTPTQFTDISLGGGEFIQTWLWDFGDISSGAANTSTLQNPTHLYGPNDSTYQVKLIVTNYNGCIDSITQDVYVDACILANFILPDSTNCARYELCFIDSSALTSSTTVIEQWRWDFGDGATYNYSSYQNPICHTYTTHGNYEVQLIVVATISGTTLQDTVIKTLTVNPTPVAGMLVDNGCLNDTTMFYDNTQTNGSPITMWHWDFGNTLTQNDTANVQDTSYLYTKYDNYIPMLIVANDFGCIDTITDTITIYKLPVAEFSFEDQCMTYYTYFNDESESDSSDIAYWIWDYGDPLSGINVDTTTEPIQVVHIYNAIGIYSPQLIIIDENNCSDKISHEIEIWPIPLTAFTIVDTVQQGNIYLQNLSQNAIEYYWDFDYDNGESSAEKNPTHQYEVDGNYDIMLVSYNDYGCPDTVHQIYNLLFTNLFLPNAFIPSNSNPELREFKPLGINLKSYRLEVYSAWGNLVFESTRLVDGVPADGWDGTYENKDLPTGSYIWRVSAVFEDGTIWKGTDNGDGNTATSGSVTLIR